VGAAAAAVAAAAFKVGSCSTSQDPDLM
jgi:hypothetical protein